MPDEADPSLDKTVVIKPSSSDSSDNTAASAPFMLQPDDVALDETVAADNSAQHAPEQVRAVEPDTTLDETVRASQPLSQEELVSAGLEPADAPGRETQPTQKVAAGKMSETQPTLPAFIPSAADESGGLAPEAQPVAPATPSSGDLPPFIRRGLGFSLPMMSRWTWIAAGGGGILVILACIGLWLSVGRSLLGGVIQTSTPTASPTLTPTQTSVATATQPVTPTPSRVPSTSTPVIAAATNTPVKPTPTALEVGVLAKVTTSEGVKLRVRGTAALDGALLAELDAGAQVKIVDGPTDAAGLTWWKIDNGQGVVGWSAGGVGGDIYLQPIGWAP